MRFGNINISMSKNNQEARRSHTHEIILIGHHNSSMSICLIQIF